MSWARLLLQLCEAFRPNVLPDDFQRTLSVSQEPMTFRSVDGSHNHCATEIRIKIAVTIDILLLSYHDDMSICRLLQIICGFRFQRNLVIATFFDKHPAISVLIVRINEKLLQIRTSVYSYRCLEGCRLRSCWNDETNKEILN